MEFFNQSRPWPESEMPEILRHWIDSQILKYSNDPKGLMAFNSALSSFVQAADKADKLNLHFWCGYLLDSKRDPVDTMLLLAIVAKGLAV